MNRSQNSEVCVKCGSCKALCPTYVEDATEGMSARGRVILLKSFYDGELKPSKKLDERIFSCILCGACNKLCPLGINITGAIYAGRIRLAEFDKKRRLLSVGISFGLKRASNSFRILKLLEAVNEIIPVYKLYPFNVIKRLDIRFPESALRDGNSIFKVSRPKGRIAIFAGCSVNFLYPDVGMSLINSLNAMNYDVVLPKGEVCCGAPLMSLGLKDDTAEMAERNINAFKKLNVESIIGLCPTCVHFIKNEYKGILGESIENAMEVSQFFSSLGLLGSFATQQTQETRQTQKGNSTVVYHEPCHSIYNLNVSDEPRQILRSMGFNVVETDRGCCGFGGTFRLLYQEFSEWLLEKRVEEYRKADMIVTSCPNCILQLRSKIKDKPVRHIVEIVNETGVPKKSKIFWGNRGGPQKIKDFLG